MFGVGFTEIERILALALLRFEDRSSKKLPKMCESAVSNFAMCISEDSVKTSR